MKRKEAKKNSKKPVPWIRHRKGEGRPPIIPDKYIGRSELDAWKSWADDQGFSPLSIGNRSDRIRLFFLFACNTNNLCKDFCKPYVIENLTEICSVCKLKKNPKLLNNLGSNKKPKDLTWKDVEAFKSFLVKSPRKAYKKHLETSSFEFRAKSTINGYICDIQSWFQFKADKTKSEKWRSRYALVKSVLRQKKVYKRKFKPVKLETLMQIIEEAKKESYENYTVLNLLLYTGGRAQFYGLKVDDIKWGKQNGETSEGVNINEMGRISTITKGGKPIEVPLHPKLQKILKEHLKTRENKDSPMLFCYGRDAKTKKDFSANEGVPYRMLRKYAKRLGIKENIHTHRIRKTVGTYGPKLGIDPKFMQCILTHEDFATTENIYREVDLDEVGKEWAKVDFESYTKNGNIDPDYEGICEELDKIPDMMPDDYKKAMSSMVEGMKGLIQVAREKTA